MISCEEANTICNKKQYNEATTWEKITLSFHVLLCKACSKFGRKNNKLTNLFEKAHLHSLTENEKERIKKELQSKI